MLRFMLYIYSVNNGLIWEKFSENHVGNFRIQECLVSRSSFLNQDVGGLVPGIACILGTLRRMTVRPLKTGRWLNHKPQNTGKEKTGTAPLGANRIFHFRPSPQIRLT